MRNVEIMGAREVCDFLGIGRTRLTALMRTPSVNFPEPLGKISAGYVWNAADIRRWAVKHRPDRSGDVEP